MIDKLMRVLLCLVIAFAIIFVIGAIWILSNLIVKIGLM